MEKYRIEKGGATLNPDRLLPKPASSGAHRICWGSRCLRPALAVFDSGYAHLPNACSNLPEKHLLPFNSAIKRYWPDLTVQ